MTTWNHLFAYSKWDRYFSNQQRADEAWVTFLMDDALRALPYEQPHAPKNKDAYGYFYE